MNKQLTMTFVATLLMSIAVQAADPNEKTVFITKESFKSNLGGLTGADVKCQAEADDPASIVPSGTYLAWLSDGSDSPDTRFTKSSHPYVLPDGTKIAENYTDLTDGSILHALNVDATGAPVPGLQRMWTDTKSDGTSVQRFVANARFNSCNAWKETTAYRPRVMVGSSILKSAGWTSNYIEECRSTSLGRYRLICFEQ